MNILSLLLLVAASMVNVDVVSVPVSKEIKVNLASGAEAAVKRDGTVTRVKVDIDRLAPPSGIGAVFHSYVVWAISPEGVLDNLGEVEIKGTKGQFDATTRLRKFGLFVTAEPHYMVDRPSSYVVYHSELPQTDFRRETVSFEAGAYDYSHLKPVSGDGVDNAVVQARTAFEIAKTAGAEERAPTEFRNAQVAIGALEELLNRSAPIDIVWPAANEAIGWSQQAAAVARAK